MKQSNMQLKQGDGQMFQAFSPQELIRNWIKKLMINALMFSVFDKSLPQDLVVFCQKLREWSELITSVCFNQISGLANKEKAKNQLFQKSEIIFMDLVLLDVDLSGVDVKQVFNLAEDFESVFASIIEMDNSEDSGKFLLRACAEIQGCLKLINPMNDEKNDDWTLIKSIRSNIDILKCVNFELITIAKDVYIQNLPKPIKQIAPVIQPPVEDNDLFSDFFSNVSGYIKYSACSSKISRNIYDKNLNILKTTYQMLTINIDQNAITQAKLEADTLINKYMDIKQMQKIDLSGKGVSMISKVLEARFRAPQAKKWPLVAAMLKNVEQIGEIRLQAYDKAVLKKEIDIHVIKKNNLIKTRKGVQETLDNSKKQIKKFCLSLKQNLDKLQGVISDKEKLKITIESAELDKKKLENIDSFKLAKLQFHELSIKISEFEAQENLYKDDFLQQFNEQYQYSEDQIH
jgi:hypothetical protein